MNSKIMAKTKFCTRSFLVIEIYTKHKVQFSKGPNVPSDVFLANTCCLAFIYQTDRAAAGWGGIGA